MKEECFGLENYSRFCGWLCYEFWKNKYWDKRMGFCFSWLGQYLSPVSNEDLHRWKRYRSVEQAPKDWMQHRGIQTTPMTGDHRAGAGNRAWQIGYHLREAGHRLNTEKRYLTVGGCHRRDCQGHNPSSLVGGYRPSTQGHRHSMQGGHLAGEWHHHSMRGDLHKATGDHPSRAERRQDMAGHHQDRVGHHQDMAGHRLNTGKGHRRIDRDRLNIDKGRRNRGRVHLNIDKGRRNRSRVHLAITEGHRPISKGGGTHLKVGGHPTKKECRSNRAGHHNNTVGYRPSRAGRHPAMGVCRRSLIEGALQATGRHQELAPCPGIQSH